jgi:hypothetical protein
VKKKKKQVSWSNKYENGKMRSVETVPGMEGGP